ncbi:PAS domain S-box protein [Sulfitobacter sp.]|uniref:PAS domain S-box protein n=1 Tax=Sulfitobacter sp. TaxID=1903071 RepID=UPI003EF54A91
MILILLVYALNRSVHNSKENPRQSRESRERLEIVISTSLDAVIVIDEDGKVLEYNGAAERTLGYSYSDAIGADMADLIIPDHLRKAHDDGMLRFRSGAPARVVNKGVVQLEGKRKNGEQFPIDLSIAAATRPEGVIYVGFIRDISDRVAAKKELLSARDEAIAGEKSKANMLAVISHEMRTLLNCMLGTLNLFDTDKLDRNHQRYLRVIRNSGNLLLG